MVEGGSLQRRQELEKMPPMKLKATAKRVGVPSVPMGAKQRTLQSSPQSSAALYRSVCMSVGWSRLASCLACSGCGLLLLLLL